MSDVGNITTEILIQIRDEARGTNKRLDETIKRLDVISVEVGAIRAHLLSVHRDADARFQEIEERLRRLEAHTGPPPQAA